MEAENKKARLKAKLRFTLVFAIALIVTTTGGKALKKEIENYIIRT